MIEFEAECIPFQERNAFPVEAQIVRQCGREAYAYPPRHVFYPARGLQQSRNAFVFEGQLEREEDSPLFVVKVLRNVTLEESRFYDFDSRTKRQRTLQEALAVTARFAPAGEARLYPICLRGKDSQPSPFFNWQLPLGEPVTDPNTPLNPNLEYVFLMRKFSDHEAFPFLLTQRHAPTYIDTVARSLAEIHQSLPQLDEQERVTWGSIEALRAKMYGSKDNRVSGNYPAFLEAVGRLSQPDIWSVEDSRQLSDTLAAVFAPESPYHISFAHRLPHLRRCHGDLKGAHVFLHSGDVLADDVDEHVEELAASVQFIDPIDFQPRFSHIDTLSDLAMLLVDVEAATEDSAPSSRLKDGYLQDVGEDTPEGQDTLEYYLLEKSLVRAYMSILYDGEPELGKRFIQIAKSQMKKVQQAMRIA